MLQGLKKLFDKEGVGGLNASMWDWGHTILLAEEALGEVDDNTPVVRVGVEFEGFIGRGFDVA